MDGIIAELKGNGGVMRLYKDRIIYDRNLFMEHSEKIYLLKNVIHVQFNKPTLLFNGFIRIVVANSNSLSNTTTMGFAEDPDTLFFKKKYVEDARAFQEKATELMAKLQ